MEGIKTKFKVIEIDERQNLIYLRKGPSIVELHPKVLIKDEDISTSKKENQLIEIAKWFAENGFPWFANAYHHQTCDPIDQTKA